MERLTDKDFESHFCLECENYGQPNGCNRATGACDSYDYSFDVWDKLKDYEKSGLSPAEVAELAETKREGRLVALPVAIGQTVYIVDHMFSEIEAVSVIGHAYEEDEGLFIFGYSHGVRETPATHVYTTREDAEAALAAKGGDSGNG